MKINEKKKINRFTHNSSWSGCRLWPGYENAKVLRQATIRQNEKPPRNPTEAYAGVSHLKIHGNYSKHSI